MSDDYFIGPAGYKHQHGTSSAYLHGKCRCDRCRTHRSEMQSTRRKSIAYGRYQNAYTDAEPVRQHLLWLMTMGLGMNRIAILSGVNHRTITQIIKGRSELEILKGRPAVLTRIYKTNAIRIMAVKPDFHGLSKSTQISSLGFIRRVQALNCIGYTIPMLSEMLGYAGSSIYPMMKNKKITLANHERMVELYDRLSLTPWTPKDPQEAIETDKYRKRMLNRGYLPPMAWDDIDHQDRIISPDPLTFDDLFHDVMLGTSKVAVPESLRPQFYVALKKQGWNMQQTADALGVTRDAVNHWFLRRGIKAPRTDQE